MSVAATSLHTSKNNRFDKSVLDSRDFTSGYYAHPANASTSKLSSNEQSTRFRDPRPANKTSCLLYVHAISDTNQKVNAKFKVSDRLANKLSSINDHDLSERTRNKLNNILNRNEMFGDHDWRVESIEVVGKQPIYTDSVKTLGSSLISDRTGHSSHLSSESEREEESAQNRPLNQNSAGMSTANDEQPQLHLVQNPGQTDNSGISADEEFDITTVGGNTARTDDRLISSTRPNALFNLHKSTSVESFQKGTVTVPAAGSPTASIVDIVPEDHQRNLDIIRERGERHFKTILKKNDYKIQGNQLAARISSYNDCVKTALDSVNQTLDEKVKIKYAAREREELEAISNVYVMPALNFIAGVGVIGAMATLVVGVTLTTVSAGIAALAAAGVGLTIVGGRYLIGRVQMRRWVNRKTDFEKVGLGKVHEEVKKKYSPDKLEKSRFRPIRGWMVHNHYIGSLKNVHTKALHSPTLLKQFEEVAEREFVKGSDGYYSRLQNLYIDEARSRALEMCNLFESDVHYQDKRGYKKSLAFEQVQNPALDNGGCKIRDRKVVTNDIERRMWLYYMLSQAESIIVRLESGDKIEFDAFDEDPQLLNDVLSGANKITFKVKKSLLNEKTDPPKRAWFERFGDKEPEPVLDDPIFTRLKEVGLVKQLKGFNKRPDADGNLTLSLSEHRAQRMSEISGKETVGLLNVVNAHGIEHAFGSHDLIRAYHDLPNDQQLAPNESTVLRSNSSCSDNGSDQDKTFRPDDPFAIGFF